MKTFIVLIKRIQRMEINVHAENVNDAIKWAENPDNANWLPWNELETVEYKNEGLVQVETPNK
jgi:hypothetical protein